MSQPVFKGSYTLLSPQGVSVAASATATATINFTTLGAGRLFVELSLPSGVTATISIGGQSFSLTNGANLLYVPAGQTIASITLNNSNTSAVTVLVYALFLEP